MNYKKKYYFYEKSKLIIKKLKYNTKQFKLEKKPITFFKVYMKTMIHKYLLYYYFADMYAILILIINDLRFSVISLQPRKKINEHHSSDL